MKSNHRAGLGALGWLIGLGIGVVAAGQMAEIYGDKGAIIAGAIAVLVAAIVLLARRFNRIAAARVELLRKRREALVDLIRRLKDGDVGSLATADGPPPPDLNPSYAKIEDWWEFAAADGWRDRLEAATNECLVQEEVKEHLAGLRTLLDAVTQARGSTAQLKAMRLLLGSLEGLKVGDETLNRLRQGLGVTEGWAATKLQEIVEQYAGELYRDAGKNEQCFKKLRDLRAECYSRGSLLYRHEVYMPKMPQYDRYAIRHLYGFEFGLEELHVSPPANISPKAYRWAVIEALRTSDWVLAIILVAFWDHEKLVTDTGLLKLVSDGMYDDLALLAQARIKTELGPQIVSTDLGPEQPDPYRMVGSLAGGHQVEQLVPPVPQTEQLAPSAIRAA